MIVFTIDDNGMVQTIANQLGEYADKAPTVLKQALNATAKDARSMLAEQAKDIYVVQKSKFNKAMTIKNASARKLEALIVTAGAPLELIDFKANPKKPSTGVDRPDVVMGKVLVKSSLKRLEMGNLKAFVAKFKSGHVSIVQRRGPERLPVKKLLSPSIPKMVGNEEQVYGKVEPKIAELLDANIRKYISKTLEVKKA
jgi:hypothetical protein